MRRVTRSVSADQHADLIRGSQLASLAEAALGPIVAEYEDAILARMVNYVRARTPTPNEQVWASLGELAACAEIRMRIESRKNVKLVEVKSNV